MAATEILETTFDHRVIVFIAALTTVLSVESRSLSAFSRIDPDVFRNVSELIKSRGYPVEEHSVVTIDGFILGVQRIPHGRKEGPWGRTGPKPVVFLQHGLLGDASNWVQNWAWNSLGYVLADNGMDVWLGNVRGNRYSRQHVKPLKPWQSKFWNWSFQEMAEYDIPAMLTYALNVSGQPQLFYIGHSQGTLVGFIGFSSNPELAKKVKLFIALAPIFSLNHITQSLRDLAFALYPLQMLFHLSGNMEFLPGRVIDFLMSIGFCDEKWSEKACYAILEAVFGFDDSNFNMSRAPVLLSNWPAGTSLRNIIHFAQIIVYGKCQMFDYGKAGNWKHYHQASPPVYNVTRMTTPTALFCGKEDTLSDERDDKALKDEILNLKYFEEIPNWNHLDFIIGLDATSALYETIVNMINVSVMSEM